MAASVLTRFGGFAFWLLVAQLAWAEDYVTVGEAYAADQPQQLVYREFYTPIDDNNRAEVHYRNADDERIATKTLDYSRGRSQPAYRLIDHRLDLSWGAQWQGDDTIRLFRGQRDDPESDTVERRSPQVIDAGFDPFVQSVWEELMNGKKVRFHFAFANRLSNVKLRAEIMPAEDSPISRRDDDWVYFRIRVDSAVLSLFSSDLYLAYKRDSRKLAVFRGRSNLPDADGEGRDVEIRYRY